MELRFLKILYRLFLVFSAFIGIYLNFLEDGKTTFMGKGTSIYFYTLQSNIWTLFMGLYLLIIAIFGKNRGKNMVTFKYIITVSITITFIVYWFMLAPYLSEKEICSGANLCVHLLTPVLMIGDFLLFDLNEELSVRSIPLVIILPLYYLVFALVRARVSDILLTRWF